MPGGSPRPGTVTSVPAQLLWVEIFKFCVSATVWAIAPKFGGAEVRGVGAGASGTPQG